MASSNKTETVRFRAAKACKACNQRRVKCDAVERGTPCTRCEQSQISPCTLIESKRGTYSRKAASETTKGQRKGHKGRGAAGRVGNRAATTTAATENANTNRTISEDGREPNSDHPSQTVQAAAQGLGLQTAIGANPPTPASPLPSSDSTDAPRTRRIISIGRSEGNESSPYSVASGGSSTSSYREISWPSMFDHFLDNRRRNGDQRLIDKCCITYLGESFPLSMVLDDLKEGPDKMTLHHPGPPVPEPSTTTPGQPSKGQLHPSFISEQEISILESKGVFQYPEASILEGLVACFIDHVYPLYPIVNTRELLQQIKNQSVPWILLHSVCFIASTFCPLSVLLQGGFVDRRSARLSFHKKAKALFDAGYEVNKIVILQSTIMLAFWAGGPNDQSNFYTWNSTAVTIAEALGLHRSMARANISPQDRRLLRRLWWILVIRDASCGALFGRPFRINLEFCDTEMLTADDFHPDDANPEFCEHPLFESYGHYQTKMAQLSLILRRIVGSRFCKDKKTLPCELRRQLEQWRAELPPVLQWDKSKPSQNVFSLALSMLYDHHLILGALSSASSRHDHPMPGNPGISPNALREGDRSSAMLDAAAQRIYTTSCGLVRQVKTLGVPHEAYPSLFLAEVVFYTQMRSSIPSRSQLGYVLLTSCQMVWHGISEAWDSAPWVMRLFDNLISHSQSDTARNKDPPGDAPCLEQNFMVEDQVMDPPPMETFTDYGLSAPLDGVDLGMGFMQESWHSHPMLSSFLETDADWMNFCPQTDTTVLGAADIE